MQLICSTIIELWSGKGTTKEAYILLLPILVPPRGEPD